MPSTSLYARGTMAALDACHQITITDQGQQDQATLTPLDDTGGIGDYSRTFQVAYTSASGYHVYDVFVLAQIGGVVAQISYQTVGTPDDHALSQYAYEAQEKIAQAR